MNQKSVTITKLYLYAFPYTRPNGTPWNSDGTDANPTFSVYQNGIDLGDDNRMWIGVTSISASNPLYYDDNTYKINNIKLPITIELYSELQDWSQKFDIGTWGPILLSSYRACPAEIRKSTNGIDIAIDITWNSSK